MAVERIWFPPAPDGTIDAADRARLGVGYGGVEASAGGGGGPVTLEHVYNLLQAVDDKVDDLHDEAFGRWHLDSNNKTLTMYRKDGTTLAVFDLNDTTATIAAIIERVPRA